jgi:hypothetical protein
MFDGRRYSTVELQCSTSSLGAVLMAGFGVSASKHFRLKYSYSG